MEYFSAIKFAVVIYIERADRGWEMTTFGIKQSLVEYKNPCPNT